MTVVYSDGTSITVPTGNRSGLDITLFLNAMKDQYLPMWGDAINKSAPLKSLVPTAGTIIGGKRSLTSIRTGNVMSAGVGFFEHDTLAPPKQPTYEQPELFARAVNTRVRITGHVERAGRAGQSAVFTNAMKDLLKSARTQHMLSCERMATLGTFQVLATVISYVHGTFKVTIQPRDGRTSAANNRHKHGTKFLGEGMDLSFIAASGGNVAPTGDLMDTRATASNRRYIAAGGIDTSGTNPVITLDSAAPTDFSGTAANALIVPWASRDYQNNADDADGDSHYTGFNGLYNLIAVPAIKDYVYGLSRTSKPFLAANYINGAGTPVSYSEHRLSLALDRADENPHNGDEATDVLFLGTATRREHVIQASPDRHFAEVLGKRGWTRQVFRAGDKELPLLTSRFCPEGTIYGWPKKSMGWFRESPIHMPDGRERFVDGQDARELYFVESGNYAQRNSAACILIEDVDYSTTGLVSEAA